MGDELGGPQSCRPCLHVDVVPMGTVSLHVGISPSPLLLGGFYALAAPPSLPCDPPPPRLPAPAPSPLGGPRVPATCCRFSRLSLTPGLLATADPAGSDARPGADGWGYPGSGGLIIASRRPGTSVFARAGEPWGCAGSRQGDFLPAPA